MKAACVLAAVLAVAVVRASPAVDSKHHINSVHSNEPTVEESLMKKLNTKCSNRDVSSCMMLKLVTYFNRMLKKSQIELGDVEISQTSTETVTVDSGRSMKDVENMPEEVQLSQVIADKLYSFVKTRSLKWKVVDGADLVISGNSDKDGSLNLGFAIKPNHDTPVEEGRKKKDKGGGGGMEALMAAAVMKIGLLKALAFKALVLLVGKALLVSKLALVLAAIIGLKKLLHSEKHVTYEVVAQPHHEHHHISSGGHDGGYGGGGGGGWGRTFDAKDAQNMAYSAHVPPN